MSDWIGLLALVALGVGCANPCDMNLDGDVDDIDLASFQDAFNSCRNDPDTRERFNERADFNEDGCVTQADFSAYIEECGGE